MAEQRRQAQAEEVVHLKKVLVDKDREVQAARASSDAVAREKQAQLDAELTKARARLAETESAQDRAKKADTERELAERKWQ